MQRVLEKTLVSTLNGIELVFVCMIFFWVSNKASGDASKRGIFFAYPVEKHMALNFVQEILVTFVFLFLVFMRIAGVTGLKASA